MKLSTKARYGLRAALDLAEHYGNGPVQMKVVAQRQAISAKYLEHLLAVLKSSNLVRVSRGAHGGYELARPPREISLGEVIRALEGSLELVDCAGEKSTCPRLPSCVTREVWQQMKAALEGIIDNTTLADLVEKQKVKSAEAQRQFTYNI
jgi:Rrf2 family protein